MVGRRKNLGLALVLALVATLLCLDPVRSLAGEFLDVFRVQRFKPLYVSPQDMAELERLWQRGGVTDLERFGRVQVFGESTSRAVRAAEAEQALGMGLRLPGGRLLDGYAPPEFYLDTLPTVSLTLDVKNVNAFLRSLGSRDLLPAGLEGKTLTMKGYPVCRAVYYRKTPGGPPDRGRSVMILQSRSPELILSPGVDAAAVRAALLGIPGLPENLRRQLESIGDWRHTLPVPTTGGTVTEVTIKGCSGVFVGEPSAPSHSTIMWEDNGFLYAIQGSFTLAQAQELARSMAPAR